MIERRHRKINSIFYTKLPIIFMRLMYYLDIIWHHLYAKGSINLFIKISQYIKIYYLLSH